MKISQPEAMAIAAVFANIINKASFQLSSDNMLVLEALMRANPKLKELSISEIGDYLSDMSEESLKGLGNNVKGIYHELVFVQKENSDGDDIYARLFPDSNHPGADVILNRDGVDFSEIQLKATDNIAYVQEHFVRYPDIPIVVTSEVSESNPSIDSSGVSNASLEVDVSDALDGIESHTMSSQIGDTAEMSGIVSAAINANRVLSGEASPKKASMDTLKDVGAAVSATAILDILFS